MQEKPGLILPHGGYRKLRSFQCAEAVYDATVVFCNRFIDKRSRTHDQMVQAARSKRLSVDGCRLTVKPLTPALSRSGERGS